jgi:hypothetical protein
MNWPADIVMQRKYDAGGTVTSTNASRHGNMAA